MEGLKMIEATVTSSTININNNNVDANNATIVQSQTFTKPLANQVNSVSITTMPTTESPLQSTSINIPNTNISTVQFNKTNINAIPVTVVANYSQQPSSNSTKVVNQPISVNSISSPVISNGISNTTTPITNSSNNTSSITQSPQTVNSNPSANISVTNGFANCVNCNDVGVKAAFYGKSKLYCSVACQNGVKKQQQSQPSQGVKRTIEALNHSPINNNVLNSSTNSASSNLIFIGTNPNTNITTTATPSTPSFTNLSNSNSMSINNGSLQTLSTPSTLSSTTSVQSNLQQLPSINTITVLSVPTSNQLTNNGVSGTFISNTLKANLVNNGSINQQNTNNLAQLITNAANLPSNQNFQIINGTQLTSITPLNSISHSNTILNNISSVTVDASNIFTVKENQTNLVGVPSNNNMTTIPNEATLKGQQISKIAAQSTQGSNGSSSNPTGTETPLSDSTMNILPPAKRPRRSSVSSSISNSGSTYSTSSKHEAKSTISIAENNENIVLSQKTESTNPAGVVQENPQLLTNPKLSPLTKTSTNTLNRNGPQNGFDWPTYLEKENATAACVQFFKHVPLRNHFENFSKKLKQLNFEVINTNPPPADVLPLDSKFANKPCYWYANVVKFAGYYAKLRYLGYEDDSSADFWVHFCDPSLHAIGYSLANGFPLVAPYPIYNKISDISEYTQKHLFGKETLPQDYASIINESLKSKFKKGMILELVDKKKLSSMRVSRIIDNIGGRLRMKYENSEEFDDFWCNESSELIHPVGWSMEVGHEIYAPDDYKKNSLRKYKEKIYDLNKECSPNMFKKVREAALRPFKVNMKLETIDPLCLSSIRVATVAKILKNDYLMIRIDGAEENDMFCYHRSSPSIFPAGFCQKNNLKLHPPYGYQGTFTWEKYLKETRSEFAPIDCFYTSTSKKNPFEKGMKLESVDLMEPKMICVATVTAVVDRLILLSFDGWDNQFDQWVDWESCDIYPMGWAKFVGYSLEEIRKAEPEINMLNKSKRARKTTSNPKKK